MSSKKLKIHTENILPIIKGRLYSDKDIFIRELVSNSCDALLKFHRISKGQSSLDEEKEEKLQIDILIDRSSKTLQFIDNGVGMTQEEVEKCIAQIAFSGAEEFAHQYQDSSEAEQIIGHFGLGFYSAYMVAHNVTIDTLSFIPESEPAFWCCSGSSEYTLKKGSRSSRGTTITLFLDKENEEFLDENRVREILLKHCRFLSYPIFLNSSHINDKEPLWLKPPTTCTEKEYIDFYRTLYPAEPDPIFWVHLNIEMPFHLKGILYFPKMERRFDWSKSHLQLFVNRVFVSDNCKDLIPDFLICLKGVIDSSDIPINVSRSSLQMDRTIRTLSSHITKKVADRLGSLYQLEREKFLKSWPEIENIIKLGILQDDKFYARAKEFLIWKTSLKTSTTLEEYVELHPDKNVFYTTDAEDPLLELYKTKPVLFSSSPLDLHLFSFLEAKISLQFQRIDAAIDPTIIDPSREKHLLDAEGRTEEGKMASFFRRIFSRESIEVEAKSLQSDTLPTLIVLNESTRRFRDAMILNDPSNMKTLEPKKTFVINTNHPLITTLYQLGTTTKPDLVREIVDYLYDISSLAQKESSIPPSSIMSRSTQLIEKLLKVSL